MSKKIRLEDVGKNQMEFILKFSSIRAGGKISKEQLSTVENIIKF